MIYKGRFFQKQKNCKIISYQLICVTTALRIKIRKEIKETLENEGYSKEEIEKELNDLVEEEILEREQERQRDI